MHVNTEGENISFIPGDGRYLEYDDRETSLFQCPLAI